MLKRHHLLLALLVLGLVLLVAVQPYAAGYSDLRKTLATILWQRWFDSQDSTWQHGFLVPFITGWLIWQQRGRLAFLSPRGSWLGLVLLLLSLFCYYVGFRANNYYFGALSIYLYLPAATLWVYGWQHLKQISFALLIFAFAWPVLFLEDSLGFALRNIMTRSVAGILQLIGAPIFREGTSLISSPTATAKAGEWLSLNVEGPCSGMRSLFALMLVSALFSYFRQPTLLRRIALFSTSIPLAILGNMVRVFLLIVGSALFGQDFAVGDEQKEVSTYHFIAGIIVFIVAVLGLEAVSKLMNLKLGKVKQKKAARVAVSKTDTTPSPLRAAMVLGLSVLAVSACAYAPQMQGGEQAGVTLHLPERVTVFTSQQGKPDKVELDNLPTDTEFAKRSYFTADATDESRDIAHVSIVLAGSERRSIHRPEVCLTGQGWSIIGTRTLPISLSNGHTLHVKDLSIERQQRMPDGSNQKLRAHYVYWFVGTDTTTPSHFRRIWLSTWDSVFRNVNHRWAYPSIMAMVTEDLSPSVSHERHRTDEQTVNLITHLIQELAPQFQRAF
jgi:exosortase